jgi:hypothetical protein
MRRRDFCGTVLGILFLSASGAAFAQDRRDRQWREYCERLNHQRAELQQRIEHSRGQERERLERWRRDVYEREIEYCRSERWRH